MSCRTSCCILCSFYSRIRKSKRTYDLFKVMEPNDVLVSTTAATLYSVFSGIEITTHVIGFAVTFCFLSVFCRIRSLHPNLIMVICSFIISCVVTSVLRIYYLVRVLSERFDEPPPLVNTARLLRLGGTYAGESLTFL